MSSIPVVHKSGIRSLKLETQEVLPDCYLTHRRSPSYEVEKTEMSGTEGLFELECKKDLLWVMTRYLSSYLLKTLLDELDNASFESALNNENISYYIDAYAKFRHDVRTGHLGKTA